jgi:hypothetical protein
MVGFICFFLPPVIAVALTAKMRKEIFRYDQYLAYYAVFTVIINGILFWIITFRFGSGDKHSISASSVFTTSFAAKYILLSSVLALVSARILEIFRQLRSSSTRETQEENTEEKTGEDE